MQAGRLFVGVVLLAAALVFPACGGGADEPAFAVTAAALPGNPPTLPSGASVTGSETLIIYGRGFEQGVTVLFGTPPGIVDVRAADGPARGTPQAPIYATTVIEVKGSDFTNGAVVSVDGTPQATTFVDPGTVRFTFTAPSWEADALALYGAEPPPNAINRRTNQEWWIHLLRYNPHPLQERLAWFLHDHFATSQAVFGDDQRWWMHEQVQLFRRFSLPTSDGGLSYDWRALLVEMCKDRAMLEWLGGNDGLNTVVPTHLQPYYDRRPTIGLTSGLLDLGGRYMLHPGLAGCKTLWDLGELAVVNKVGYPNRNLSHFTSQNIYSYGVRDAFANDLKARGMWNDCMVLVISEFGRRNYENGSRGTDHGHCFLIAGGAVGTAAVTGELAEADLNLEYPDFAYDFREIYADIVENHIGVDAGPLFPESFTTTGDINLVA